MRIPTPVKSELDDDNNDDDRGNEEDDDEANDLDEPKDNQMELDRAASTHQSIPKTPPVNGPVSQMLKPKA